MIQIVLNSPYQTQTSNSTHYKPQLVTITRRHQSFLILRLSVGSKLFLILMIKNYQLIFRATAAALATAKFSVQFIFLH
jgi:hypothetical protein